MRSHKRLATVLLLALLSPQAVLSQPAERDVLVTVRGLGPEDRGIEADLCRVLEQRLGAEGWHVTCSQVPNLPDVDATGAKQAGAVFPYHIEIDLTVTKQIEIEVSATFALTDQAILSLSLVGPRRLGIERKAETIAGELLAGMNTHLEEVGGSEVVAALLAEKIAESVAEQPTTEPVVTEPTTTEPIAEQPTPEPTVTEPTTTEPIAEQPTPEPTVTGEAAEPAGPTDQSRELELARQRRIGELERELALLRRRRKTIIKRSSIAWIAGGALLGGAGGVWVLAGNNYKKYEDAAESQKAVDYREKTLLYRNIAVGVGITGGSAIAGGLGYLFFAARKSGLSAEIAGIQQELLELKSVSPASP